MRTSHVLANFCDTFSVIAVGAKDLHWVSDVKGSLCFYNASFEPTLGYALGDLTLVAGFGLGVPSLGVPDGTWQQRQHELFHKDGSVLMFESRGGPVLDGNVVIGWWGIERSAAPLRQPKQAPTQVKTTQKLDAVSTLVGGILHEFNNVLAGVFAQIELTLSKTDANLRAMLPIHLRDIESGSRTAIHLTQQAFEYAQTRTGAQGSRGPLNVSRLTRETYGQLRRVLPRAVELRLDLRSSQMIIGDPLQVHQLLWNLLVDACPETAHPAQITVNAADVSLEAPLTAGSNTLSPGDYVMVSVTHGGAAISESVVNQTPSAFRNPDSDSIGSGREFMHGIVKACDGAMLIKRQPGRGTNIRIYLPAVAQAHERVSLATKEYPQHGNTQTIIVCEDSNTVRAVTARTLRSAGYHVLEADCGTRALGVATSVGCLVSLLVTDIVMPDMDGHALSEQLALRHEGMHTLFVSACMPDSCGVLDPDVQFLMKPFHAKTLLSRVRAILKVSSEF